MHPVEPAMADSLNALMRPPLDLMVPGTERDDPLIRPCDSAAVDASGHMMQRGGAVTDRTPQKGNAVHVVALCHGRALTGPPLDGRAFEHQRLSLGTYAAGN